MLELGQWLAPCYRGTEALCGMDSGESLGCIVAESQKVPDRPEDSAALSAEAGKDRARTDPDFV